MGRKPQNDYLKNQIEGDEMRMREAVWRVVVMTMVVQALFIGAGCSVDGSDKADIERLARTGSWHEGALGGVSVFRGAVLVDGLLLKTKERTRVFVDSGEKRIEVSGLPGDIRTGTVSFVLDSGGLLEEVWFHPDNTVALHN